MDEKVKIVEFQRVPGDEKDMSRLSGLFSYETQSGNKGVVILKADIKLTDKAVIEAIQDQVKEQRHWKGRELTI